MSRLLWLLGGGAGIALLAEAMRNEAPTEEPKTDDDDDGQHDPPTGGGEGGDTPEPKPDPGDGNTDPPPTDPWVVLPYDEYQRGPYTIDLAGLSSGVRWRVYATAAKPTTETAKDTVKLGVGIEVSDEEARVAANAYADTLGAMPVEPYPMPPIPTPDPPNGDGIVPPESAWSPLHGKTPELAS